MRDDIASPSASRTVGTPTTCDVEVEVGDHLPDQHQLLVVLLAEEHPVGRTICSSLQHDGQHAGEMRWPRGALEFGGQRTGLHGGAQAVGIHRRGASA